MAKISYDEILEKVEYVEDYYQEAHNEFDEDFKYLTCQFTLDTAKLAKKIYPPTAQAGLDTANEHIPVDYPHVFVPKASLNQQAQEHSEKLRRFYMGLLYRTSMENRISPLKTAKEHLILCNMGILKIVYRPTKIENMDEESATFARRNAMPIIISAVHPRNFYPDPSDFPEYAFEIYGRPAMEIKARYPRWEGKTSKEKNVKWIEYQDANYRCYLADGIPVLKQEIEKHGYGFLPYSWGFADYKIETADKNFAYRTQGILRPLRSMIEEEAHLWSVNHTINKRLAWPTTFLLGADKAGAVITNLEKDPGQIIPLPTGVEYKTDKPGEEARGILSELIMVSNEIRDRIAPRSVRGLSESGVRSGYHSSLLVMQQELRYDSVVKALGLIVARTLGHASRILETKIPPEGITVWGKEPEKGEFDETITGKDVKGHYICYVEFAPTKMEDEYRRANTGALLQDHGLISKTRAQERYAGVVDPEEEQVQILADKFTEGLLPVAMQMVQDDMMKEIQARRIKEGKIPAISPARAMPGATPSQRALPQSPTGAPFVAQEAKPFSTEEEQQILQQELGAL